MDYVIKIYIIIAILFFGCGNSEYKKDPLSKFQWYLNISDDENHTVDINLDGSYVKGRGITISIVDDGIDTNHPDLINNIGRDNHSYLSREDKFDIYSTHGTSVAGIIAAEEGNGIGIRGIAPKSTLIAFNTLRLASISNLADALTREIDKVDISNNSWGDVNGWGEPLRLKHLIDEALQKGVKEGRQGKGIVYIFAAGNGTDDRNEMPPVDNVNYSGLVNNHMTLPICAITPFGKKAFYSESGSTLLVCAPSKASHDGVGIATTDIRGSEGYNPKSKESIDDFEDINYTKQFAGTSASAPMVSGIVALMLEENPNLSYRDVRYILAKSAIQNDFYDTDWKLNSAGLHVNHKYGFGLVNANKAIKLSSNWINLDKQITLEINSSIDKEIIDNKNSYIESIIKIEENITVEFVDIFFDAPSHERIGDLDIRLVSPSGTESILAVPHQERFDVFRYKNWRFGSLFLLGENAKGNWKLVVSDKISGKNGKLENWGLKIYGYKG